MGWTWIGLREQPFFSQFCKARRDGIILKLVKSNFEHSSNDAAVRRRKLRANLFVDEGGIFCTLTETLRSSTVLAREV